MLAEPDELLLTEKIKKRWTISLGWIEIVLLFLAALIFNLATHQTGWQKGFHAGYVVGAEVKHGGGKETKA